MSETIKQGVQVEETGLRFMLYYCVHLYFSNGHRDCYIESVGNYGGLPPKTDFINGLDTIGRKDESTLLLFPDAMNLAGTDLFEVQRKTLHQAGEFGGRLCIFGLKFTDTKIKHQAVISELRKNIGLDHLKCMAFYTLYLKTVGPLIS